MDLSAIRRVSKFMSDVIVKNIPLFITVSIFEYMGFTEARKLLVDIGLPLFLAYSAGQRIEKKQGGIVAIVATLGILSETSFGSLLGPIIIGVMSGWILRRFYRGIRSIQKPGYEMLVNNVGVTGVGIGIAYLLNGAMIKVLEFQEVTSMSLLNGESFREAVFVLALAIEPLKVFFLNNIVNHGIFSVLGMSELAENGKSLYFLLETNPGPGFGILMAYFYYAKKKEMFSNALIVLFGGVHEVYFVYVLKRLYLLIPLVIGSATGIYLNYLLNTGLTGVASPGSILMIELLAPAEDRMAVLLVVAFSAMVTFFLASLFIRRSLMVENFEELEIEKEIEEKPYIFEGIPKNILVVCDAGMGSSAMGASFLRQKLKKSNLNDIKVNNSSVEGIADNKADIIVIHSEIYKRIKGKIEGIEVVVIDDFLNGKVYDNMIKRIESKKIDAEETVAKEEGHFLRKECIKVGLKRVSKGEALEEIGKSLVECGYTEPEYINEIIKKERETNTYLENGVAMPNCNLEGEDYIIKSGVVIHQYPYGIEYGNGKMVYTLIGTAIKEEEHAKFMSKLSAIVDGEDKLEKLCMALDEDEIYEILTREEIGDAE